MINLIFTVILFFAPLHSFAKITVEGGKIQISEDQKFENKLQTQKFIIAGKEAELNETGFIVASAQSSFEGDKITSRWVALDERVLDQQSIKLNEVTPHKGSAYGVLSTSKDFQPDLKVGQNLIIKRYGLTGDRFEGRILKIVNKKDQDIIQIHFIASHAPELIAGTTCEVDVPHIKKFPFKVSLLSLLHLGLEDYIVIKEKTGTYFPKHVTIVGQDAENATILLPISGDSLYVARGAILLKPLLNKIILQNGGAL